MLDLRRRRPCIWDEELRPRGFDTSQKELFDPWWQRHRRTLGHFDPVIAEQWIHRHFDHSYMCFLHLDSVRWSEAFWTAEHILAHVWMEFGRPADAEFDYKAFRRGGLHPTAAALDEGTWDYPMLVLETPNGIRSEAGDLPDVGLVVAEGSSRYRYLNALHARGLAPGPHRVFVLHTPQAAGP